MILDIRFIILKFGLKLHLNLKKNLQRSDSKYLRANDVEKVWSGFARRKQAVVDSEN